MRILHTSDWHLGRNLEGRSRLPEQAQFVDELVDIADREGVHLILIAGDVFDAYNPPAEAEELYYDALERLAGGGKRAVVVVAGNHDSPDRLHAANPLALRHGIALLGYPGEALAVGAAVDGVRRMRAGPGWLELAIPDADATAVIYTLPYPSESRLNEILAESLDDESQQIAYSERVGRLLAGADQAFRPDTVNLVVAHLFTIGGMESESERQLGGALAVSPLVFPARAQYIALGHLHRPQQVGNSPACRYSGSPLSYSFSEGDQQKEVVLVEVSPDGAAKAHSIKLSCGRALKRWRARSLAEARNWCADPRNQGTWVDLEVEADRPLDAAELIELRKLHPNIISIRPIYPELADTAEERRLSEIPLTDRFKLFHQRERGVDPKDELVKFFLEMVNAQEPPSEELDETEPTGGEVA